MLLDVLEANRERFGDPEWLHNIEGLRKGRIDIRIDAAGRWYHDGELVLRNSLIRLLEDSLLVVDDDIVLRAPEQLLKIKVEDCPFLIADFELQNVDDPSSQTVWVHTLSGLSTCVSLSHPLRMQRLPASDDSVPVVEIRDGLYGRFSRNAFYRLVDWASTQPGPDSPADEHSLINSLGFYSSGTYFSIGI